MITLRQACLPWVTIFENRADYKQKMGHEAPAFDPNMPPQCWMYVGTDRTIDTFGVYVPSANPYRGSIYNLVVREHTAAGYGNPVLEPTFIPNFVANRVNLPGDQSGIMIDDQLFPIRDLQPNESLQSGFGGVPVIVGA